MLGASIANFLAKIPLAARLVRLLGIKLPLAQKEGAVPIRAGVFQPFHRAVPIAERKFWARTNEIRRLRELVQDAQHTHVIVTGSSGAGKSTLVRELYVDEYVRKDATGYYEFFDYDQILIKFLGPLTCHTAELRRQKDRTQAAIAKVLREHRHPATEALDEIGTKPEVQEAWSQLEAFLTAFLSSESGPRSYLFVFDQVERYLFLIGETLATTESANGTELYLIKRTLDLLRQASNCRTIVIIREDFLYRSMSFLLSRLSTRGTGPEDAFRLFLCEGINAVNSPQAVSDVEATFLQAVPFLADKLEDFKRLTGISTNSGANPFLAQLCGFMIEHFYKRDKRIQSLLASGTNAAAMLPLFFDHVEREFMGSAAPDATNVDLVRAVFYGIAVESKSTGLPAPADRVALIGHVPRQFAQKVFDYLEPRQIVVAETLKDDVAFRFTHDVLAEFVLHADDMSFEPVLKESMTKISENHVPSRDLTSLGRWAHFIDDFARPNFGLVALWIFYLFGLYRIAATWGLGISAWGLELKFNPAQCSALEEGIRPFLPVQETFATTSCEDSRWHYPFIFAMHCLWVTYIYYIDRNYIQHVAKSAIVRFVSMLMPAIGVVFGILLAFSPIVHVLPVTIVGTIYGFILLYLAYSWRRASDFAVVNISRGSFTLGNMLFTLALVFMVWATYPEGAPFVRWGEERLGFLLAGLWLSPETQAAILRSFWLYATIFLMIYYWSSLWTIHQSTLAAAKWLALYDRSRLLGTQRSSARFVSWT